MATLDPKFESRKQDHIRLALSDSNQVEGSDLEKVQLIHEALPDLNFAEIKLGAAILGQSLPTPFLISSMTAGHVDSLDLNLRLSRAAAKRGWLMGVGSQRKELSDPSFSNEWRAIRSEVPQVKWLGNIGIAQLISEPIDHIIRLAENLSATAMIIHLNALQEVLQPEGTPQFRGGLGKIRDLVRELPIPVVAKETGCGMSPATMTKLCDAGVAAIDVGGFGGTHWGRIEGARAESGSLWNQASHTFRNWGLGTAQTVRNALELHLDCEIWGSGGIRTGLDAAKLLAMGARVVGFAKPLLEAALVSEELLEKRMEQLEFELKVAMFCTGAGTPEDLRTKGQWRWTESLK